MFKINPIDYKKLVKIFEKVGFIISRTSGDHIIMIKKGIHRPLVIPKKKQIPIFIILNNLKVAGISKEEYRLLFKKWRNSD